MEKNLLSLARLCDFVCSTHKWSTGTMLLQRRRLPAYLYLWMTLEDDVRIDDDDDDNCARLEQLQQARFLCLVSAAVYLCDCSALFSFVVQVHSRQLHDAAAASDSTGCCLSVSSVSCCCLHCVLFRRRWNHLGRIRMRISRRIKHACIIYFG